MTAQLLPSDQMPPATLALLRTRLDQFYADAPTYTAFQSPSDHRNCWSHLKGQIQLLLSQGKTKVKVLEVGAGKTGFADYLAAEGLRPKVTFYAQDVTRYNGDWLQTKADSVHFGDVPDSGIPADMDIIFSTYVLEHVTNPDAHLNVLWNLLANNNLGGSSLFIFSPRYDLPGYLCPSARHLSRGLRLRLLCRSLASRLATLVSGRPRFLIQTDLAAFHQPFFLDADAVHWVSTFDLKAWAGQRRGIYHRLPYGSPKILTKDWIIKRFCTTAVKLTKPSA